jgi:hypothetical protein
MYRMMIIYTSTHYLIWRTVPLIITHQMLKVPALTEDFSLFALQNVFVITISNSLQIEIGLNILALD